MRENQFNKKNNTFDIFNLSHTNTQFVCEPRKRTKLLGKGCGDNVAFNYYAQ